MVTITTSQEEKLTLLQAMKLEPQATTGVYLILVHQRDDTSEMLDKMRTALKWPKSLTKIIYFDNLAKDYLARLEHQYQPKKILIIGHYVDEVCGDNTVIIPALTVLKQDKTLKKQAWAAMQKLV